MLLNDNDISISMTLSCLHLSEELTGKIRFKDLHLPTQTSLISVAQQEASLYYTIKLCKQCCTVFDYTNLIRVAYIWFLFHRYHTM